MIFMYFPGLMVYLWLFPDKPSPPRNLRATEVGEDTATLQWEPPEDDGSSDILYYILERRNGTKRKWAQIAEVPELTYVDDKVKVDNKYLYRVSAVNEVGESEPCEMETPIEPKCPYGECRIPLAWSGWEILESEWITFFI